MKKKYLKIILPGIICLCLTLAHLPERKVFASYSRYVTASSLKIRKSAKSSAKVVGYYSKGKKVTCYGTSGSWTKVKYNGAYRYVSTSYLAKAASTSTYSRYVTASSLKIRKSAKSSAKVVGYYSKGKKVTCYGTSGSWTKVKYNSAYRYVSTSYLAKSITTTKTSSSVSGTSVVNYALQFVGNPYVWGGSSLTKGADCSGFTMAVYAHYGYSLPHSSISQRSSGRAVSSSSRQAGDLICYNTIGGVGHVALYIGNNKVVHAGSSSTGIHTSTWNYRSVNCVRRIL
ncbi:MAG: NlpC/P60 family protein [Anaerostipes sp.]|nr:NlpC/P60 family protein [Anaerostipes sp.]